MGKVTFIIWSASKLNSRPSFTFIARNHWVKCHIIGKHSQFSLFTFLIKKKRKFNFDYHTPIEMLKLKKFFKICGAGDTDPRNKRRGNTENTET